MRHVGRRVPLIAATYAAVSPRTTNASAFHDHAYGSTTLR